MSDKNSIDVGLFMIKIDVIIKFELKKYGGERWMRCTAGHQLVNTDKCVLLTYREELHGQLCNKRGKETGTLKKKTLYIRVFVRVPID